MYIYFLGIENRKFSGLRIMPPSLPAPAAAFTREHLSYKTMGKRNSELSLALYMHSLEVKPLYRLAQDTTTGWRDVLIMNKKLWK